MTLPISSSGDPGVWNFVIVPAPHSVSSIVNFGTL